MRHISHNPTLIRMKFTESENVTLAVLMIINCEIALISIKACSDVTKGRGGSCPRAQQTRGRKTASPKYFNEHVSEFDEVC